jgi:putative hydrolase of the HAD superfamily
MHLASIAAISLDLDDTLWAFEPAVARAEQVLHDWLLQRAPKSARILSSPQVLRDLRVQFESMRPELAGDMRALRLGSIRLVLDMCKEDPRLAEPAYDAFFAARQQVDFFDDALPALQWLSERFPLVAVSNGNANLRLTGGHQFFKAALNPQSFGSAKPDSAIFHAAADAAGCAPGHMLHVGDDPDLDVAGAIAAGAQAAWVVRSGEASAAQWARSSPPPHLIVRDLRALCLALER